MKIFPNDTYIQYWSQKFELFPNNANISKRYFSTDIGHKSIHYLHFPTLWMCLQYLPKTIDCALIIITSEGNTSFPKIRVTLFKMTNFPPTHNIQYIFFRTNIQFYHIFLYAWDPRWSRAAINKIVAVSVIQTGRRHHRGPRKNINTLSFAQIISPAVATGSFVLYIFFTIFPVWVFYLIRGWDLVTCQQSKTWINGKIADNVQVKTFLKHLG